MQCGSLVGARAGAAYAGIRTDEVAYQSGARHLAEGTSIRATGRLLSVDKDTVCHWLPRLGSHCDHMMSYFFRNLYLSECQLDEFWTFIYKKEDQLTSLDRLLGIYGMLGFGLHSVRCASWYRRGSLANVPYPMPASSFFG
jgi:hypothetical protein